jgi:hypothetical protein
VTAACPGIDSSPPEIEQVVLHSGETHFDGRRQGFRQQQAHRRIQLVHRADRFDARRVLGHARAVAQAGGAGVAGARDDLRKSVTHESYPMRAARPCAARA